MAQLLPELNPLQIGTRGEFDGQAFTLLGRVRLSYEEGSWNEWFALFGDGRYGWIAQAQGFFMASFETPLPPHFRSENLAVGNVLQIEGAVFRVTDRKNTVCLGGEGELPFAATPERTATSVDLSSTDGRFANVELSEDGNRLFVGRYARFDDLKFTELRNVPGWSNEFVEPERNKTTAMNCKSCGAEVTLRAAGLSMSAVCPRCATLLDTATPELQIIRRAQEKRRIEPIIPLGQRGKLFDVNYEVIGFQHVDDGYGGWNEYLLFNPWQGFVWLVTYSGHWSLVRRLYEQPRLQVESVTEPPSRALFESETYRLFAVSNVSTTYVLGEFYWKVCVGMKARLSDYICPPRILSCEAYPQLAEQTWSQGEYIEPKVVQEAFGLEQIPDTAGVYLNQPNPHSEKARQLKWIVPILVALLGLVQWISTTRAANQKIFQGDFVYHAGISNPPVMTEPFEVKGSRQPLEFALHSPVDNNWIEVGIDVVNTDTKQVAASFEQGIEYYHGYDDGPWSEGSTVANRLVSAVPPGKYYLLIDSSADPAVPEKPFDVTITRDVPLWANFWIALALLLAYPVYRTFRAHVFERTRWMDSDYSPYAGSSSDDEDD
jgi:hypothetical protein